MEIPQKIKEYIDNHRGPLPPVTDPDEPLQIDSLGIVRLIAFLETDCGIRRECGIRQAGGAAFEVCCRGGRSAGFGSIADRAGRRKPAGTRNNAAAAKPQ